MSTEDAERKARAVERYDTILRAVGDGIYELDASGRFVAVNDVVTEVTGYSRAELLGEHVSFVLDRRDVDRSLEATQEILAGADDAGVVDLEVQTADGRTTPVEARFAVLRTDDEVTGTVGVVRDISERKEHERRLREQKAALERLARINRVIRSIHRSVVGAATREEIEWAVCQRLTDAGPYVFAWVGEADLPTKSVTPTMWARRVGDADVADAPTLSAGVAVRAATTDEVEVDAPDPNGAPWYGGPSVGEVAAVPLTHEGTSYGILTLHTDRGEGFTVRERAVLEELGESIAHAVTALERKAALMSDRVVELAFHVAETSKGPVPGAENAATIDRTIPLSDGTYLLYYTVTDGSPERFREWLDDAPSVREVRTLATTGGESRFETRETGQPLTSVMATYGGRTRSARVGRDGLEVVADFPEATDVRRVAEAVTERYPSAQLVSRQTVERTTDALGETVLSDLTESQQRVLETAYHGDYFEWPRGSTGEELAETLGVSAPTFHEHLRAATRKLVTSTLQAE